MVPQSFLVKPMTEEQAISLLRLTETLLCADLTQIFGGFEVALSTLHNTDRVVLASSISSRRS
jgi:hypothetical protein